MKGTLSGGLLTWADLAAASDDLTFVWQDLDGLHVATLPQTPPPTSILHGWSSDGGRLVRARSADGMVMSAWLVRSDADGEEVVVDSPLAAIGAAQPFASLQIPDLGEGPLTFVVPTELAGGWRQ